MNGNIVNRQRQLILVLTLCALGVALAQSFASLTVTPRGSQNFDLSTNVTTLDEGGLVVDKETGLELEADFIRFEEGSFIEAEAAQVLGKFGSLATRQLFVDSVENVITAEGDITLNYNDLNLTANALTIYSEQDVVVLEGNVQSDLPSFESERLAIYLDTEQALLLSPYTYTNGTLSLRQTSAGKLLQLSPRSDAADIANYNASTTVTPDLLAQLEPYLGQP